MAASFEEIWEAQQEAQRAQEAAAPYVQAANEAHSRLVDLLDELDPDQQTQYGAWLNAQG